MMNLSSLSKAVFLIVLIAAVQLVCVYLMVNQQLEYEFQILSYALSLMALILLSLHIFKIHNLMQKAGDILHKAARGYINNRLSIKEKGSMRRFADRVNGMLDTTEIFLKETTTSLERAKNRQFFGIFPLRGLQGNFRQANENINLIAATLQKRSRLLSRVADKFGSDLVNVSSELHKSASNVYETLSGLRLSSSTALQEFYKASASSSEANRGLSDATFATEKLSRAVRQINEQTLETSKTVGQIAAHASVTNQAIRNLQETSNQICASVEAINKISEQADRLAVNATIEAATAGERGKGFSAVASEIKTLARHTSDATAEINLRVENIKNATKNAIESIEEITHLIEKTNKISALIAAGVKEQSASSNHISSNMRRISRDTRDIAREVRNMEKNSQKNGETTATMFENSENMLKKSDILSKEISQFLQEIKVS